MEKEKLISVLKEKLGTTQLSERTISDFADGLVKSVIDDALYTDDFYAAQVAMLKSFEGQLNHDIAAKIDEFKKNNPPKQDDPNPKPTNPPTPNNDFEQYKTEMEQKFKELNDKFANYAAETLKNNVKANVESVLKKQIHDATGADANAFILNATLRDMEIGDNPDVSEIVKAMQTKYDENLKAAGITTDFPSGGGGGGTNDDAFDKFFEQKAAEGMFPKSEK